MPEPRLPPRKRLPPYGRALLAKRQAGLAPANCIFVVDDYRLLKAAAWRVVVPREVDPLTLDFSFVAGLEVMLLAANPGRLEVIATAIAGYGPRRLIGASITPPKIVPYIVPDLQ